MKIAIGIPNNGSVRARTALCLMSLKSEHELIPIMRESAIVCDNRNQIITKAREMKADYLLFIDTDMIFPADLVDRLLAHKKEIVGTDANRKVLPLESVVNHNHNEMPKELFKAETVGTGVILIDMKVFFKIQSPYFAYEYKDGQLAAGEDYRFCKEAAKAGIEVWCDPTIEIGHLGDYIY